MTQGTTRSITYTYDDDNRISVYKKAALSQNFTYDSFGRTKKKIVKNGDTTLLTTTYSFKTANGNETTQINGMRNAAAVYNVGYTHSYDGRGNITRISDGTYVTTYEYDESNQLIRENNQKGNFTHVWIYNSAGNIRYKKIFAYTTAATLGTPTQTITYAHGNSAWTDLLTAVGDQTYTYDQIGNLLSDGKRTYTWEHGRQLAALTVLGVDGAADTTWTNTYNADGLRIQRTDGATTYKYYYAEGQLICMYRNSTRSFFAYTPDGLPYYITYGGNYYVYALNQMGDVMAILNTAGQAVVEYTYDAWGNILDIEGSMASTLGQFNPLRYRGYVYDNETQLYYLQSRYYDPEIGRFISADGQISAPGNAILGNNMYAYCFNNPVNSSDPSGNWPKILKEIGARLTHAVKISTRIITSPLKATTFEVGSGVGYGASAKISVDGFPIEVGASATITDSYVYDKGKFDLQNTSSAKFSLSAGKILDLSLSKGKRHSYFDEQCTCSYMGSTFGEKTNCKANKNFITHDAGFGASAGLYLGIGFEISFGFDFKTWGDELISIYNDSLSYKGYY